MAPDKDEIITALEHRIRELEGVIELWRENCRIEFNTREAFRIENERLRAQMGRN